MDLEGLSALTHRGPGSRRLRAGCDRSCAGWPARASLGERITRRTLCSPGVSATPSSALMATPSTVTSATPLLKDSGFSTTTFSTQPCLRTVASKPGQCDGITGDMCSRSPRKWSPSMYSTATRYIQAAEPVYQVQPPRPTWGGTE